MATSILSEIGERVELVKKTLFARVKPEAKKARATEMESPSGSFCWPKSATHSGGHGRLSVPRGAPIAGAANNST